MIEESDQEEGTSEEYDYIKQLNVLTGKDKETNTVPMVSHLFPWFYYFSVSLSAYSAHVLSLELLEDLYVPLRGNILKTHEFKNSFIHFFVRVVRAI